MTKEKAIQLLEKSCLKYVWGWAKYKGKAYAVQWNVEATMKAKKPMLDLAYCLTTMENDIILNTVQFDKNKFIPL